MPDVTYFSEYVCDCVCVRLRTDVCLHAQMCAYILHAPENSKCAMNIPMCTENTRKNYVVGPEF